MTEEDASRSFASKPGRPLASSAVTEEARRLARARLSELRPKPVRFVATARVQGAWTNAWVVATEERMRAMRSFMFVLDD